MLIVGNCTLLKLTTNYTEILGRITPMSVCKSINVCKKCAAPLISTTDSPYTASGPAKYYRHFPKLSSSLQWSIGAKRRYDTSQWISKRVSLTLLA